MLQKILQRASLGIIALAAGLMIWFYWTIFAPIKVVEVSNQPVPVSEKIVKAGSSITYTLDYCKTIPLPAEVFRQLVDTVTIPLEEYTSNAETGCHTGMQSLPSTIPSYVPPGDYHIQVHYVFHPYPWRIVEYSFETETFKVVK
jgi:hypothetical protein